MNMNREELKNTLNKMFCNYIQESDDMAIFYEVALAFVEENSNLDFDNEEEYNVALQLVEEVIVNK